MVSEDLDRILEVKRRLADRYTSAELVEFLDVNVYELIDEYWDQILEHLEELLDR